MSDPDAEAPLLMVGWPVGDSPPTVPGFRVSVDAGDDTCRPALVWLDTRADTDEKMLGRLDAFGRAGVPVITPGREVGLDGCVSVAADLTPGAAANWLAVLTRFAAPMRDRLGELALSDRVRAMAAADFEAAESELRQAALAQRRYLPGVTPAAPGLAVATYFRPAGHVGGDMYDVRPLAGGRIGFVLLDAPGHGVAAALAAQDLRARFPWNAMEAGAPEESLAGLNAALLAEGRGAASMATAVAGVLDPATWRITLAAAGHPPPLHVRPGTDRSGIDAETVALEGRLLGVLPNLECRPATLDLAPDATLIVHTDGFESAFADESGLVNDRFVGTLTELAGAVGAEAPAPGRGFVERLDAAIAAHAGSLRPRDDLTLMAFGRRTESDSHAS